MSIFKIFRWRGFWVVFLFVFITFAPARAFALFSWSDVLSSLAACDTVNPTCTCWVEEILTTAGAGFRVWKRCANDVVYSQDITLLNGLLYTYSPPGTSAYACDGVSNPRNIVYGLLSIWKQYSQKQSTNIFCSGVSLSNTINEVSGMVGEADPCLYLHSTYVNCTSYDVLVAQFEGLQSDCQIDYFSIGADGNGDWANVACACVPDRYIVTQYPFTDTFGGVGCKVRSVVGDPVLADTPIVLTDGMGGAINTNYSLGGVSDGIITSPTTTTTTIPADTSGGSVTNNSTTTTTVTGGVVTNTTVQTSQVSNYDGVPAGSQVYTTTSTTPTGTTTTKTGCIDANGDGIDDGSGFSCSSTQGQFTDPGTVYNTELDTLVENDWGGLIEGWWAVNPYSTVINGTYIQTSGELCELQFTIWGVNPVIDFCSLQPYFAIFGGILFGIVSLRSVFFALGGGD